MLRPVTIFLALSVTLGLGACSDDETKYVEAPVEKLYNDGVDALQGQKYKTAQKLFEEVERQHPYSVWATRALLQSAFAAYQAGAYDDAVLSLDRFIQLHPGNKDIAYAYYMRALCYYEQIVDVGRDQKKTEDALNALNEVVRRFPESQYARDSRAKIDLARDQLAGKEMEIGRYYLRDRQYVAAIGRFRRVVEQYQTTSHIEEALHRLVEAYVALGVMDEAKTAAAVLGHNFPGGRWYADSYKLLGGSVAGLEFEENKGSWISRAWRKIF